MSLDSSARTVPSPAASPRVRGTGSAARVEEDHRRADYLTAFNSGWFVFGLVALVTLPFYAYWQLSLVITAATMATFVAVKLLLRREQLRSASFLFCFCMDATFLAMFLTLVMLNGADDTFRTQAPVLILMGLTSLIAAALFGPRAALAVAVINSIVVIGLRLLIAPDAEPRPSILVFHWLLAGVAFLYENSLKGVFAELRGAHNRLEETVAHRTAELSESIARLEQMTQKLRAANRDLDLFSTAVAHDLRNPLLVIAGYSRNLQEDIENIDTGAKDALRKILEAEARMQRLIDGLMAFARLGQHALRVERVRVQSVIERLTSEHRMLERERTVSISIDQLPDCTADPILIEQVLANLLTNALKFTRPRTAAEIRVAGHQQGDEVIYSVSDNGVGFAMEDADRLFTPLHRIHTELNIEGSGIGLAAVERMIKLHGGRVWAQAEPGKGATFFFSLPNHAT